MTSLQRHGPGGDLSFRGRSRSRGHGLSSGFKTMRHGACACQQTSFIVEEQAGDKGDRSQRELMRAGLS